MVDENLKMVKPKMVDSYREKQTVKVVIRINRTNTPRVFLVEIT